MRMFARLATAALAVSALLGPGPGSVGASMARAETRGAIWEPHEDEQWLFDLRTSRLTIGNGVRGYSDGRRTCVVLEDIILALDLPLRIDPELRRATGWAFDERQTIEIDRATGRARVASRSIPLPENAITDTDEGWCVDPAMLGQWLGIGLDADLSNSVLRIDSEQALPFELAVQRRARAASLSGRQQFNLADLPQARRPYSIASIPSVDVVASAAIISDARTGRTDRQLRYELFASGELFGASYDARLSSDSRGIPASLRVRAYRSDPNGELFGPLQATHVAVGDVTTLSTPLVSQPVVGRGAMITNRALDLPDSFDRTTFRGDLPAGWDAELYRNGQLLGFATPGSDGRYEFTDVRLQFGVNRFEVVLYGPQGQVRREVRNIPVGLEAIPPQKTYYWAGIVQEGRDLLRLGGDDDRPFRRGWRGTFGIERGLNRRMSVGAWATSALIDDMRYNSIEGLVRHSIGSTLAEASVAIQNNGGRAGRLLWAGQVGENYFTFESLLARGGYRSDRVSQGVTGRHSLSIDLAPRIAGTVLPLHLEANYRQQANGINRLETGARVSANWRSMSFTTQLDWVETRGRGRSDGNLVATLLANARLGQFRIRGEARIGVTGNASDDRVAVVADWNRSERADMRVEMGYESGTNRVRAGVGYTRRFEKFALTAQGEIASDGSVAAGISVNFAIGPDPRRGGIRVSRDRLAAQGQALARLFYDDNGDGRRQAGEEFAQGITLTAGNSVAAEPTDAEGVALIDALAPFRPVLIGVDETSLSSPLVRPAIPGVVVTPRPGVVTEIAIPLVAAGEIEGILIRRGGTGIEGLDLEVVDASGHVRALARTDFDGFFIIESVPYGQYQLRVSMLSAAAANISPDLGTIILSRERPRVRLGTIAVDARAAAADVAVIAARR